MADEVEEAQGNGRLSLASLLQDKTLLNVTVGGRQLTVCYRPAALRAEQTMDETLTACVTDWGLDGEDGKPVPVSSDGLEQVPWLLRRRIWQEILTAAYPN